MKKCRVALQDHCNIFKNKDEIDKANCNYGSAFTEFQNSLAFRAQTVFNQLYILVCIYDLYDCTGSANHMGTNGVFVTINSSRI